MKPAAQLKLDAWVASVAQPLYLHEPALGDFTGRSAIEATTTRSFLDFADPTKGNKGDYCSTTTGNGHQSHPVSCRSCRGWVQWHH